MSVRVYEGTRYVPWLIRRAVGVPSERGAFRPGRPTFWFVSVLVVPMAAAEGVPPSMSSHGRVFAYGSRRSRCAGVQEGRWWSRFGGASNIASSCYGGCQAGQQSSSAGRGVLLGCENSGWCYGVAAGWLSTVTEFSTDPLGGAGAHTRFEDADRNKKKGPEVTRRQCVSARERWRMVWYEGGEG